MTAVSSRGALSREIGEETGLKDTEVELGDPVYADIWYANEVPYASVVFWATTTGATVTLSDEHDEYRWMWRKDISSIEADYATFAAMVDAAYERLTARKVP